uniref:Runt domain-containing protein n=1 Tax=Panagrolaimus sp. JU765 TaxID=591449 RepID=A0AC34RKF0_9BILA
MPDFENCLTAIEEALNRLPKSLKFIKTGSPGVYCSSLPNHWRSNKSLPNPFMVIILYPIEDGTRVTVSAGNEENCSADVKNNVAEVQAQVARFSDLRFVGKSGRGKNFNLTLTIHRPNVYEVAVASSVIKVTVDGPRDSRNTFKQPTFSAQFDSRKRPFVYSLPTMNPLMPSSSNAIFEHCAKRERLESPNTLDAFKHPAVPLNPLLMNPFLSLPLNQFQLLIFAMNQASMLSAASSTSSNPSSEASSPDLKEIKPAVWRPFL